MLLKHYLFKGFKPFPKLWGEFSLLWHVNAAPAFELPLKLDSFRVYRTMMLPLFRSSFKVRKRAVLMQACYYAGLIDVATFLINVGIHRGYSAPAMELKMTASTVVIAKSSHG